MQSKMNRVFPELSVNQQYHYKHGSLCMNVLRVVFRKLHGRCMRRKGVADNRIAQLALHGQRLRPSSSCRKSMSARRSEN